MPTIYFEPTLYLFLGGTPGKVGYRLKDALNTAYGDLPIFRYLWVDADRNADPAARRGFSPNERSELAGFDGDATIQNLDRWPLIRNWWPTHSGLVPGYISDGAHQIRTFGRLALFRMYADPSPDGTPSFISKLTGSIKNILHIENAVKTEELRTENLEFRVRQGRVKVVIIFSICGGTGSGIVFDVAYLCHHLLATTPHSIVGYAILPQVIHSEMSSGALMELHKTSANSYAWFKDHEYLLKNPVWNVDYPGQSVKVQNRPFKRIFVFDIGNERNQLLNQGDDIYQMVADALFLNAGSTTADIIDSYTDNVPFDPKPVNGRHAIYSSLAVSSRIYPKDKVLKYCGARLAKEIIEKGLLIPADPSKLEAETQRLITQLEMVDTRLLESFTPTSLVQNAHIPDINAADSVGKAIESLLNQEKEDALDLQRMKSEMALNVENIVNARTASLKRLVAELILTHGTSFAENVRANLERIWAVGSRDTGNAEKDALEKAQIKYSGARGRLSTKEGDLTMELIKALAKKKWDNATQRARNDCLTARDEVNRRTLGYYQRQKATDVYTSMYAEAVRLKNLLVVLEDELKKSCRTFEEDLKLLVAPASHKEGIYELAREVVDKSYYEWYYVNKQTRNITTVIKSFQDSLGNQGLEFILSWKKDAIKNDLVQYTCKSFQDALNETSLLRALQEYHGKLAPERIEAIFHEMLQYCSPFWRYDHNQGIRPNSSYTVIGIASDDLQLIPEAYADNRDHQKAPTENKYRIDTVRLQHNLPAFLLAEIGNAQTEYYKEMEEGIVDPQHVIREAESAEEVIPEEHEEARSIFAQAIALGFIIKAGGKLYYDPKRQYGRDRTDIPPASNLLAEYKKRHKAEETFILHQDWVRQAKQLIDTEILTIKDAQAKKKYRAQITLLSQEKAKCEDFMQRRQLDKEIRALDEKIQDLS